MSMEDADRHETVTYWRATGKLNKFAKPIVYDPIELLVRWEDRTETIYGRDHAPLSVDAVLVVDRDIPEGSIFWRGALVDATNATGLMRVQKFTDVPDIKGRNHRRVAYISRYGDVLPDIEVGTGS